MVPSLRFLSMVCLGCGLLAQDVSDLNSLVLMADRFATRELAPAARRPLDLYRIVGSSGKAPDALMLKAVDVGEWTLMYQPMGLQGPPPLPPGDPGQSVNVHCLNGMFTRVEWSPLPIFDCKVMQGAWITVSLDAAIQELGNHGHGRGFTALTLMRPLHPRIPGECTFIFKCVPDQAFVGISAQTGKLLWTEPFSRLEEVRLRNGINAQ